ncbi:MAG: hypothetical protein R2690_02825 [Acidimicrobiales bacterium]
MVDEQTYGVMAQARLRPDAVARRVARSRRRHGVDPVRARRLQGARRVAIVDHLPRDPNGKVRKAQLRSEWLAQAPSR